MISWFRIKHQNKNIPSPLVKKHVFFYKMNLKRQRNGLTSVKWFPQNKPDPNWLYDVCGYLSLQAGKINGFLNILKSFSTMENMIHYVLYQIIYNKILMLVSFILFTRAKCTAIFYICCLMFLFCKIKWLNPVLIAKRRQKTKECFSQNSFNWF